MDDAYSPQHDDDAQVQEALDQARASVDQMQDAIATASGAQPLELDDFADGDDAAPAGIEMLSDVDLEVTIELGRTQMLVEDVLKLGAGSVVEIDKLAGDPVDVHVNGRLVARGEVLVLNDQFCIRISEIVANLEEQAQAFQEEQKSADASDR